jgi:hypothetical protein
MGQAQSFAYNLGPGIPEEPPKTQSVVDVATCVYATPLVCDMAIGLVFFNPAKSKRMLMNYLYTVEKLKRAKLPYYTLELVYGKEEPEIADAFHYRAKNALFNKEQLCRLLERRMPWRYSKVVFLDADLVFTSPTWYADTSKQLGTHQVVQPFSSAVWLDITYTKSTLERSSVVYMNRAKTYDHVYHPGFAWAFKRSWFRRYGFYEYAITGSGDTLSTAAWMGVEFPKGYLKPAFARSFADYRRMPKPTMSCTAGKVYHLWHGTHKNRKYVDRHQIVDGIQDVQKIIRPNWSGVFEVLDKEVAAKLLEYFAQREDDGT